MEKLTIEHLAPYFPHGLLCTANNLCFESHPILGLIFDIAVFDFENGEQDFRFNEFKPLLTPLDEIQNHTVPNENEFHKNLLIDCYMHPNFNPTDIIKNRIQTNTLKWVDARVLFKYHFDVFGLIDKGLAIDKTLTA